MKLFYERKTKNEEEEEEEEEEKLKNVFAMDTYFLVLLGSGLHNEKHEHYSWLQKGFDIIADPIHRAQKQNHSYYEKNQLQDSLLSLLQSRRRIYFAISCSRCLQHDLLKMDPQGKSCELMNNSDWMSLNDSNIMSDTQKSISMLTSRSLDKKTNSSNCTDGLQDECEPVTEEATPDDEDDDDDDDIANHIHHLADLLPVKGAVVVNIYWILPDQEDLNTMKTLPIFGAFKRLQHCNNALVTILTSNKMSSDGFLSTWKTWLNFSVLDMTNPLALKDVPLWHGSLTCVGLQRKSKIILPGFALTSASSKQLELELTFDKSDSSYSGSSHSIQYLKPEIQILRYIPRTSVPLYLLLPIKLKLHLEYQNETSQMFIEDLHCSSSKGLGLLACMSMTAKPEERSSVQNLESWMDYMTSATHLGPSQDFSAAQQPSSCTSETSSDVKRLCLILSEERHDVTVFLFRQPDSLNGKIYEVLQNMTRGKKIVEHEDDTKLHVQDLSDTFFNTEKEMSSLYTKNVLNQIDQIEGKENGISEDKLRQILQNSSSNISPPQRKRLQLTKKINIDLSSTMEDVSQSASCIPPSRWPERLWLKENDPTEIAAREAKKKAPIPIEEVLSMDVKDILKRFHSDGRPVREDLSPLRSAYKIEAESHILINTTEENIKKTRYPEALAKKYHGVEYCLDSRDALSKDIQIARTQTSIVKQETLSSCIAFNSKRLDTIRTKRVTRSKDKDQPATETTVKNQKTSPKKRTSPAAKQKTTRQSTKRKRSESPRQQGNETGDSTKTKETRSQRHKRRLRLVVEKTLAERGINNKHDLYSSCSERLYTLIKSFLKDLKSSHGLNDTMKELAQSNVDQVINFEKTRLSVK